MSNQLTLPNLLKRKQKQPGFYSRLNDGIEGLPPGIYEADPDIGTSRQHQLSVVESIFPSVSSAHPTVLSPSSTSCAQIDPSSIPSTQNDQASQSSVDLEPPVPKRSRSSSRIWTFFDRALVGNGDTVKCKHCAFTSQRDSDQLKKATGSTSNFEKHLAHHHPTLYTRLRGQTGPMDTIKLKSFKQEEFDDIVVDWIVDDMQAFGAARNEKFVRMINYLRAEATVPSRQTDQRRLLERFEQRKAIIIEKLESIDKVHLAFDTWTSKDMKHSFMDFKIVLGQHTGENLAQILYEVLTEYHLLGKIYSTNSDNAGNNTKAHSILQSRLLDINPQFSMSKNRLRCFSHIIKLIVKRILGAQTTTLNHLEVDSSMQEQWLEIETEDVEIAGYETWDSDVLLADENGNDEPNIQLPLNLLRKLIIYVRGSSQRREEFKHQCLANHVEPLELIRDIPTRWNSTYFMIERSLKLRLPIGDTMYKHFPGESISNEQWQALEGLGHFLKQFSIAHHLISKELDSTLSHVIPLFAKLQDMIFEWVAPNLRLHLNCDKAQLVLQKYLDLCLNCDMVVISTILDPRIKINWFERYEYFSVPVVVLKESLTTYYNQYYKHLEKFRPSPPQNDEFSILDDVYGAPQTPMSNEIERYLLSPCESKETNP